MSPSSVIAAPGRRSWSPRCSSTPAPSTASARVDDGTTVTDYDEEEIARKHTLSCSLAYVEWNKHKINFIDTPGMANFLSDARAALRVADAALVVVDAVAGVEVSTEKIWAAAEELGVPRIVVLNRLDRERASLERSLESLRDRLRARGRSRCSCRSAKRRRSGASSISWR